MTVHPFRPSIADEMRNQPAVCHLYRSLGTREPCPGEQCSLWESGGAVVEAGCAVDRLGVDLEARPDLALWLLDLREALEKASNRDEAAAAWTRYRAARGGAYDETPDEPAELLIPTA